MVTGTSATINFVRSVLSVGAGVRTQDAQFQFPLQISRMANLRGLIFGLAGNRVRPVLLQEIVIGISIIVMFWIWRSGTERIPMHAFAIAIGGSVLVSYYLFIHDLSYLIIPLVLTLDASIAVGSSKHEIGSLLPSAAVLVFAIPSILLFVPNYFYLLSVAIAAFLFLVIRS
jgi:hypothetical protein